MMSCVLGMRVNLNYSAVGCISVVCGCSSDGHALWDSRIESCLRSSMKTADCDVVSTEWRERMNKNLRLIFVASIRIVVVPSLL